MRTYKPKPPTPCDCGVGAPHPKRFGQGHQHRSRHAGGFNAHDAAWYAEREKRRRA